MKVIDAIARILKIEGAEFLSAYPTTPLIEAAAKADIRPVLCRQERVGVGIADGYARVTNGKKLAVFCMQYGPGAENAFPGVATAYSDSTPMLLLPLGRTSGRPAARRRLYRRSAPHRSADGEPARAAGAFPGRHPATPLFDRRSLAGALDESRRADRHPERR